VPKVLADLVDSDREFQTVGAATANDRYMIAGRGRF